MSNERVAVVTGAASGIGLALVERFVAEGTKVALADIDAPRLVAEAARLRSSGATVIAVPTDVGDPGAVDRLADQVVTTFGRVDILCNNAGSIAFGSVWDLDLGEWDRVLRVNLLSVVHGVRSFIPALRQSGDDGHIVNVASMAAFMQLGGVAPYVATKHGVVGLSIALAEDLRQVGSNISVTVVCPGMVSTRFGQPDSELPPDDELPAGVVSAAEAAGAIGEAMVARRFYAFTHADSEGTVLDRYQRIAAAFR